MKKLIFIFLDGVGIGKADRNNPFFAADAEYLPFYENGLSLPDRTPIKGIDAKLGVPGIPMSATGQTTLFTGVNVPAIISEHRDSYPDKLMRKVIKENNIFSRLKRGRKKVAFLNAYPGKGHFFNSEHARIQADGDIHLSPVFRSYFKGPLSVTSCMMLAGYMNPFDIDDILKERALYHDFSNISLIQGGMGLPIFKPEKAAEVIYNTSRSYDMVLYEFFQTDMYGHGFDLDACISLVRRLNRLLKRLFSLLDKEKDTFLLTSDHGNLEDCDNPLHTLNPVPLVAWGAGSEALRRNIKSLADVTPAIVNAFRAYDN